MLREFFYVQTQYKNMEYIFISQGIVFRFMQYGYNWEIEGNWQNYIICHLSGLVNTLIILSYKTLYSFQKLGIHNEFIGIYLYIAYAVCCVLHQWLLPSKTSNNHDIWYTGINFTSLEVFPKFLITFDFKIHSRQKKGHNMAQKCKLDVTINIYSMKHPIMMFDTQMKSQIVYRDFLIYFENFKFTICFKNGRVKKWSKMTYISRFSIKCFRFF